ncbi:hypothetical protein CANMA_002006 [Candida margitis]|uniref:uncharacterized protein n=1 Tax=Candida margitis TaxID=1775924 RepID=UPI002227B008|nr:uncharacterized protein CANMA_002006 [Candida margitis]KAI5969010.1 hypothetical protein CANMA_002006 [Candida margitis]
MNKFRDLPDIDYTSQEVFESSDVESDNNPAPNEDLVNEALPDVNLQDLQTRFADTKLANNDYDFSGNLLNKSWLQVDGRKETKQERLARIKRELEELQQEEETSCPVTDALLQQFNGLKSTSDKPSFPTEEELRINEILVPPPEPVNATPRQGATLAGLENKLSQLEKQLGINNTLSHPVQHSINDITRKINIISHADYNIDAIKSKIETTGKEMEKLELNKRLFGWEDVPTPKQDKIDELYKLLPDLEKYCGKAPMILERLKSLNMIHNEVEESLNFTINLNQFISDLDRDMKQWNKSLDTLNRGLDVSKETFDTNRQSFQTRLAELENRLG